MKRLCITYHMSNEVETAESCVTLTMEDVVAEDIIKRGGRSVFLDPMQEGDVWRILRSLAAIQGYKLIGACHFEEVPR